MTFLRFPREIRDLVYSFIIPEAETYIIPCTKKSSLPRLIFRAKPELRILWVSRTIHYEFLERLCAISTFRFTFPRVHGVLFPVRHPVSASHASLLQRIEIESDLLDSFSATVSMLTCGEMKGQACRIILKNNYNIPFKSIMKEWSTLLKRLKGYETVTMVQNFKLDGIDELRPRWYMGSILGPSHEYWEGSAVCWEFHPRRFVVKRS